MANNSWIDVKSMGAKGDGTTNDTVAIQNAINAVSAKNALTKIVYFPQGTYLINQSLVIKDSLISLTGDNAVITSSSSQNIGVLSGMSISNLSFNNVYLYFPYNHTNLGRMYILNCVFKNESTFAIYSEVGYGINPVNLVISDNLFDNCSYGVYGSFSDSIISNNKFQNSPNRNIELTCGSSNQIIGNRIDKGVTGIAFLVNRSITQGRGSRNNIVQDNIISNISEEAISLDVHGDATGVSGSVIYGSISSILAGSAIQIIPNFKLASQAFVYVNMYMVYLTGQAKGQVHLISSMGADGKSFLQTATGTKSNLAVGDKFVIMVGLIGNIIANNIISSAQTGIALYGDSFETVVTGNRVENCSGDGISITSLYGVLDGSYGMAFNNRIENNIIYNANLSVITISFGSSAIDINATGNAVSNNTITNGSINYTYQDEILLKDNILIGTGVTNITNCLTSLPTPSAKYLSQQRYMKGKTGTADSLYVCMQLANGTYQWRQVL